MTNTIPACFAMMPGWCSLGLDTLTEAITWQQSHVRIFGKEHAIPRLTSWMGDGAYTYSGIAHQPAPMPAAIAELRSKLEALTGARFNSVLANLYRDGRDSVAWHSDDEPELGSEPVIASISIGATRTFKVRSIDHAQSWNLDLRHGDLLVMSGRSQADYQHAVPKTSRPTGARINLTFRHVS